MTRPLRIGLLVDEPRLGASLSAFVAQCREQALLEVSHLVVHPVPRDDTNSRFARLRHWVGRRGLKALAGKFVFHGLRVIEQRVLQASGRQLDDGPQVEAASLGLTVIEVHPQVSPSGFVYRFGADDLQRLSEQRFDVLLRFGSGILRGAILQLPTFGVLSFHHGDNHVNRGGPPGYWEVQSGQDATGFIIQRLTEELDGGQVLYRGWLQTRSPFLRNQQLLLRESLPALTRLLTRLAAERRLPVAEPSLPYSWPLLRSPGVNDSCRYVTRQAAHWGRKLARRLQRRYPRWTVAVQRRHWRDAVLWRATPVPNPPGHFLADPFVITHEGRTALFVEDFDYVTGKGTVAAYFLDGGADGPVRIERAGTALDEPFHLSYPFLFRCDGELFMCPESQQQREVRVYRCLDFPLRWELASVLMRNVDIVDSVIFERDGRWWLLGNQAPNGANGGRDDSFAELHAFHADHPLSQHWTPHPANPLLLDARRARNGGLLRDGEAVFRVSQRYGFDQYGVSATIARVSQLDTEAYAEESVQTLEPTFRQGLCGLHHLHSEGGWTVFDFARYERIDGR